jgi:hypothetical protein
MLTEPRDAAASADAARRRPPSPALAALAALQVFKGGRSNIRTPIIIHILTVLTHPVSHLHHPEHRVSAQTTGPPHSTEEPCKVGRAPEKGHRGATPRRPQHCRKPFQFCRCRHQVSLNFFFPLVMTTLQNTKDDMAVIHQRVSTRGGTSRGRIT